MVIPAQILCDLAIAEKSSEFVIKALLLLEQLLAQSPSNFHAKLMCLKMYHLLGCGSGATKMYESLGVKHIQLDSMGYLHCALLPSCFLPPASSKFVYQSTMRFFSSSAKDSVEYLAMSYRFGSFSKLQEFMDFRDRLANSLHNHINRVEQAILEIVSMNYVQISFTPVVQQLKILNINPDHRIDFNAIQDNRDLSVIFQWDPVIVNDFDEEEVKRSKLQSSLEHVKEVSFQKSKSLLKIRSVLLNLILAQVNALTNQHHHVTMQSSEQANGQNGATKEEHSFVATVQRLQEDWKNSFDEAKAINKNRYSESYLVNSLLSGLESVLLVPYEVICASLSSFVILLLDENRNINDLTKVSSNFTSNLHTLTKLAQSRIQEYNEKTDKLWVLRDTTQILVAVLEILSCTSLVVSCCLRRFSNAAASRKSKRSDNKETIHLVTDIAKSLKDQLIAFEKVLGRILW